MPTNSAKTKLALMATAGALAIASAIAYATATIQGAGSSDHIGLAGGPAKLVARELVTPRHTEPANDWHYHPGYVYNVVAEGTITVEDGCGEVTEYAAGEAFETSEGRVHRAYNSGDVDAVEYNMFVNRGSGNGTLTKFIPTEERRCGPPSSVDECKGMGWMKFDWPSSFANQG